MATHPGMPADGPASEVRTDDHKPRHAQHSRPRGAHRARSGTARPQTERTEIPRGRGAHRAGAHRRREVEPTPAEQLAAAAEVPTSRDAETGADSQAGHGATRSVVAAATVAVTAIGVGITGTVVSGPVSHASPPPTTTASVEKQVNALNEQMDAVVEKYDRATLDLTTAKRQAAVAKQRVAAARQRLAQAKADLAQVAAAAYRGSTGAESVVNSFVAADNPQQFVDQTTTLDELSRTRVATLQAVIAAEKQLAAAQRQADDELAAAQRIAVQIARHKAEIRRALRKQRELLGHLQAQERARLAAHQAASAQQESALGAATVASGHYGGTGSAAVAVEWAYRELGKPYVWGAAGPNGFDCSGLTMYVWARAGVSLPHSAAAQYGAGTPVSRADLQPGDLVFFGSPIYHVGIYVGGGNMIEAPHTGDVVKVMPLAYEPNYAGAVRP